MIPYFHSRSRRKWGNVMFGDSKSAANVIASTQWVSVPRSQFMQQGGALFTARLSFSSTFQRRVRRTGRVSIVYSVWRLLTEALLALYKIWEREQSLYSCFFGINSDISPAFVTNFKLRLIFDSWKENLESMTYNSDNYKSNL